MKNLPLVAIFTIVSFGTVSSQPVWVRENIGPGASLLSVNVVDPFAIVCVGVGGRIVRTTDGGTSWNEVSTSVNEHLFDVTFSSSLRGTAVGMHGTILRTIDGGASWNLVQSGTEHELYEVEFATVDNGWIVGAGGTILATTNGGDSWMPLSSGTTANLYGIAAADPMNLVAVGGFVSAIALTSTNGGQTWAVRQTGLSEIFFDIDFRSSLEATAVGSNGLIASTTDGGISWMSYVGAGAGMHYGIQWTSPSDGLIVGTYGGLYTTDGGLTWTRPSFGGHDIHTSNGIEIIAGRGGVFRRVGNYGWVLQESGTTRILNSVSTAAFDHAIAVGDSGFTLKTTDGGSSWQALNSGVSVTLNGVWFSPDAQHAVTVGNGGTILTTSNGGATWNQRASGVFSDLRAVDFSSNSVGTAVGVDGIIIRTTNGGVNWSAQTSGTTAFLNSVSLLDDNLGIVGISNFIGDKLLQTTNGGTAWSAAGSSINGLVFAVSVLSSDNWVTGSSYRIYRTIDAGVTWTGHVNPTGTRRGMAFPDPNSGWVVGRGISITRDNGLTWNDQLVPTQFALHSISMWDTSRGVAVGEVGTILRTMNGGTLVVEVRQRGPDIPVEFLLDQNYPNPFNPSTTIRYEMPFSGHVRLSVYNILGQEITTLVNEEQNAGYQSVVWKAGNVASGVYFYRLQSASFVQTRKMLLLR
ncbi:MAG TPA: YCF48-related protein [Bacteroidota bacterium]